MKNETGNGRLTALLEKEQALRAQIAKAREDQQRREAKNRKRLAEIIGAALLDAQIPPETKASISQILSAANLEDRAKRLLKESGWAS